MAKKVINEKQLRSIIRNVLKETVLNEFDYDYDCDDRYDDYDDRGVRVSSSAEFYFNPKTYEIISENDPLVADGNALYINFISSDFPDAYYREDGGSYWTAPSVDYETGECGGDFEIDEYYLPDDMDSPNIDARPLLQACTKANEAAIIDALTQNADFE